MDNSSLSLAEVKKRVISSFMSLTARQIALRAINYLTLGIILVRILPVETLGVFYIATGIITFFAFFSDVGLAASLIQKKEGVTSSDIKSVFTIQQILVGIIAIVTILAAPTLSGIYNLGDDGVWLIRILGFSFFLSSLKVIPSVMLERELKFHPLVLVEIVETIVFNVVIIFLAKNDFGLWSFSYAAIARGLTGTILIYILAPVKISIGIERASIRQLLSFGVPFQLNSLLALAKDRLVPLVVAAMVGPAGVSYATWAQSLAFMPLELMNAVIRITFPAFSRIQHDKQTLGVAVEKSLFFTALMVYPALFGLAAIIPSVITHVVSAKMQPALTSFYLFAFSTYWAVISTTFTNTMNAMGSIKVTLKLMIMWTTLTWVLTPILVYFYGFIGVAMTSFLISFTSIVTIVLIKRMLDIRVLSAILMPTIGSALMGLFVYGLSTVFVNNWFTLILAIFTGALFYVVFLLIFGRARIFSDLSILRNA